MMNDRLHGDFIYPGWPAPHNVKAVMTTRSGGVSEAPFGSMNLGDHVNDCPDFVNRNRMLLQKQLALPRPPVWLSQVHGITALHYDAANTGDEADAIIADQAKQVCAIMTADCLPVLFCNKQGTVVAGAHAGWRGLEAGVLESTLSGMKCAPEDVLVWLGAAIGSGAFEVGPEVREVFIAKDSGAEIAFKEGESGKWFADLYKLARVRLESIGVNAGSIYGGSWCTYLQPELFYSYRRESRTGRMASLIWLD